MGECRYSSTILDLRVRWMWMLSYTSWPIYPPGKKRRYPLDRRLGGPQSWSGRRGEVKISFPFRESIPGRPARSPSLYRLSYRGSMKVMNITKHENSEMHVGALLLYRISVKFVGSILCDIWKVSFTALRKLGLVMDQSRWKQVSSDKF
jgi:hypothetical protein